MPSSQKDYDHFDSEMKQGLKIADGFYRATTAKRITLVIPEGIKVYDTNLDKMYVGDGITEGGVAGKQTSSLRVIPVASGTAAVATASGATSNASTVSWSPAANLRTGDGITVDTGGGTLPSGLTTATEYFCFKPSDVGNGASNTNTRFSLASTRNNAISGTIVTLHNSGAAGWLCKATTIVCQKNDNIVHFDPCGVSGISCVLPDANNNNGFTVTIKKDTGAQAVKIKELDLSGNVSASGSVTIDSVTGYGQIAASAASYATLFAQGAAGEYFTTGESGWSTGNA